MYNFQKQQVKESNDKILKNQKEKKNISQQRNESVWCFFFFVQQPADVDK